MLGVGNGGRWTSASSTENNNNNNQNNNQNTRQNEKQQQSELSTGMHDGNCDEKEQLLFRCNVSGVAISRNSKNILGVSIKRLNENEDYSDDDEVITEEGNDNHFINGVSTTHDCLPYDGFDQIYNFRSLGEYTPLLQGLIYRSALLDLATEHDINRLATVYNIKTIIDLRGNPSRFSKNFSTLRQKNVQMLNRYYPHDTQLQYQNNPSGTCRMTATMVSKDIEKKLAKNFNYCEMFWFMFLWFFGKFLRFLANNVSDKLFRSSYDYIVCTTGVQIYRKGGGPLRIYKEILQDNKSRMEICRVLKVCTIPERQPILFHCKSGKDRTGVITLFLLTSVGCSREEIIADYTRSHSFVCSNRHYELTGQLPYRSLSKNDRDFLGAKREYMIGMMDHIDKQYGGVFEYLDSIGFDERWRNRLNQSPHIGRFSPITM